MNKSLVGILGVIVVLILLVGCIVYDCIKDQFIQLVVKDVKKGMLCQQVMQIVGKFLMEVIMVYVCGICQIYIFG